MVNRMLMRGTKAAISACNPLQNYPDDYAGTGNAPARSWVAFAISDGIGSIVDQAYSALSELEFRYVAPLPYRLQIAETATPGRPAYFFTNSTSIGSLYEPPAVFHMDSIFLRTSLTRAFASSEVSPPSK